MRDTRLVRNLASERARRIAMPSGVKQLKILNNGSLLLLYENGTEENMVDRHFRRSLRQFNGASLEAGVPRPGPKEECIMEDVMFGAGQGWYVTQVVSTRRTIVYGMLEIKFR